MYIRIYVIFTLAICSFINTGLSQNAEKYFKYIPRIDKATPEWAKMMYEDNPNVWEVEKLREEFYKKKSFTKSIHTQNYKYWRRHIDGLLSDDGLIVQLNPTEQNEKIAKLRELKNDNLKAAIWTNIGPFQTYNNNGDGQLRPTQTNVYCITAAPSNPDILFCGTEGGGFFKSIDRGLNWSLTTLNEAFSTGADVKIHPSNPNIVYIAAGNSIHKSIDGGDSWTLNQTVSGVVEQLLIHASEPNKVFAATANGLYFTDNDGSTWNNIKNGRHWDIRANPLNPNTIYLSTKNTTAVRDEIFKSTDGGLSWTLKDNGWYTPTNILNADAEGCKIGLTPADTNRVYTCLLGNSKAGDQNWIGVYYSLDGGDSWTDADGQDGGPYASGNDMNTNWYCNGYEGGYNQGWYNFDLDVSHSNPDRIWIGTIWDLESNNRGANLEYFRGTRNLSMHADVQDIEVIGSDIWIASDGGINYSNDEFQSTEVRNHGISASNFWGFSQGWNEDTWTGGRYHNGDAVYHENFGLGNTMFMGGAESATGHINQFNNKISYYDDISSKITPNGLNQASTNIPSLALYPNSTYSTLESSELESDPRYGSHMYLGRDNIFYKSINSGITFNNLYTFPAGSKVLEFEIARKQPDLIYCLVRLANNNGTIYKSLDGGISFNPVTPVPSNNLRFLDLSINQANEDQLWVISRQGANGQKVYASEDGGITWVNKTTSTLDGHRFVDIDYQSGSNDIVYILSDHAVFYWGGDDWVVYSDGLPLIITEAREIELFYRDSKVRMSSARGIWEAPFAGPSSPVAQPITSSHISFCSRDTIQMECFSILDHSGASWQWSFDPSPQYIDDVSKRNPLVVFDQDGGYEVTLTVSDGAGKSSTQTIPDFITLDNKCAPDTIPGLSLQCSGNGEYTDIPDLNLLTNEFTISAWVKPNGLQSEYTGIVMNDGTSAGLNFGPINNQLAYHWPGGQWWWASGLFVPAGIWSHVALVATPNSLTVYLNGIPSTHNISLDQADLQSMKIGSFKGWNGRNFKGEIDEVALWNRSLSQNEIREIRHITRTIDHPSSDGLISYYQFNQSGSTVLDKIGNHAALMNGGASKVPSSAPIGGGESHRLMIDNAGTYSFGNTETEITFDNRPPNGEIVVSRLHVLPNILPSENPNVGNYWVINNYGNPDFDPLIDLSFKPFFEGPLVNQIEQMPSTARLFKRTSNEHTNRWEEECSANKAQNGIISFDNTCAQTNFSQYTIVSNNSELPIELLNFTAFAVNNKVVNLNWETAFEINNDYFNVERSSDGINWESIYQVSVGTNSSTNRSYNAKDPDPLKGYSFYRLKQTDLDGKVSFSQIKEVNITYDINVSLSPNPATKWILITNNSAIESGRLLIYNSNGKLNQDVIVSNKEQRVDVSNLSTGIYFYTFSNSAIITTGKLAIE